MGDLAFWMDENYLYNLFVGSGELQSVKIIRNKVTGASEGYGFIEFRTHEAAEAVLKTYNGVPIPNTEQVFRLNWAAFGVGRGATEDFSVFVGDLAPEVTDYVLQENFRQFFPSVRSAKVITDPLTGKSKGYGFVRFGSETERDRALSEMNGHFLSSRPIRVSLATAKKNSAGGYAVFQAGAGPQAQHLGPLAAAAGVQAAPQSDADPTNTTLFIGGLSGNVSEAELRGLFGRFGDIVYVKIPAGKGCGFVQYMDRGSAERAMAQMHGHVIGNGAVRISWGRSSTNRGATQQVVAAAGGGYPFAAAAAGSYAGVYGHFAPQAYPGYGAGHSGAAEYSYPSGFALSATAGAAFEGAGAAAVGHVDAGNGASFLSGLGVKLSASDGGQSMGKQGFIPGLGQQQGKGVYEPLAQCMPDTLNGSYIQNHQPGLVGSHLFA